MDLLKKFIDSVKPRFDDDAVDRLNNYYTTSLIGILAITISAKQYVGQSIQCWVPKQFADGWEKYTENYCFVENTYWVPMKDTIPENIGEREGRQIAYYQWVPLVLALQAVMFHLPRLVWKMLNWQSGVHVRSILKMACDTENVKFEKRDKTIDLVTKHIANACRQHRNFRYRGARTGLSRMIEPKSMSSAKGIYVTVVYLFVKLLYVANVVGQFFILNKFLGMKYKFWGAEVLTDLSKGIEWESSGHFPRVTLCDLEVRELGNLHRWTVQCVLMVNMFNEKVYLFLWWWFLLVAVMTIINFLYWLWIAFSSQKRIGFISKYLQVAKPDMLKDDEGNELPPLTDQNIRKFVRSELRADGVLVLRLVSLNAGDIILTDIIKHLWIHFQKNIKKTDPTEALKTKSPLSTRRNSIESPSLNDIKSPSPSRPNSLEKPPLSTRPASIKTPPPEYNETESNDVNPWYGNRMPTRSSAYEKQPLIEEEVIPV